ncbi:MAG: hypothetical protein WDZ85_02670 [Candidatus Paceibacterota bacterium]
MAEAEHHCLTDEDVQAAYSPETDFETRRALMKRINTCVFCKRRFLLAS